MDSWRLVSQSCSCEGESSDSIIEKSFISRFLKAGGLEEVLFLLRGQFGVEVTWEEGSGDLFVGG